MWETLLSYLCSVAQLSFMFLSRQKQWEKKHFGSQFPIFQWLKATRCVKGGGTSALLCSWGSFSRMDYLLSFDVSWPHLTGAERRSAFSAYFLFLPPSKKTLYLREPWSLRAALGLLQHCVLCIIVLISTDNIPADPRFQSCRLKGQNFSPSSPRRLIPGFTSSALRKFNCNLGLDWILLLQKVGATW